MITNLSQFNTPNPALPRRTDDPSLRASQFDRGGPVPPSRTLAGKVAAPMNVGDGMMPTMAGLGENSRPPGCALGSDGGSRMLGMDRRSNGNGMQRSKSWRY
jgi:hypothetical protein